jgi:diacylglycerol kinase family enzyme
VALANGRYQGGGILIAPQAAIDDGLIDVTLVERAGLVEVAANLRLLYSGDIWSHPKVHHWRAVRVRAEAEPAAPLELDGEPLGTLPLEAEVLPRALRLILPAATAP